MKRRELVILLGAAAMAWPLSVRAQPGRMRRIGVLMNLRLDAPDGRARLADFRQGLRDLGWIEGQNVTIDDRWAAGSAERSRMLAKELVGLEPDALLAQGNTSVQSLAQETASIPIVFVNVSDPIGEGFVASVAHPGRNITGFGQYEDVFGKWVGLIQEIAPGTARIAALMNADDPPSARRFGAIQSAADAQAVRLIPTPVRDVAELERALDAFAAGPNGAMIMLPGFSNKFPRERIAAAAARLRLPAVYPSPGDVMNGGLMSFGVDAVDQFRQAPGYVDRIFKGEKPADLPVQQPAKFELVVNLKTAKTLGLAVPPALIARASQVIE